MHPVSSITAAMPLLTVAPLANLHPAADGHSMLLTLAVFSVLAGFCSSWLLVGTRLRLRRLRRETDGERIKSAAAITFRDALLAANREAAVVLTARNSPAMAVNGGDSLLEACRAGPESKKLAGAIEGLMHRAVPFYGVFHTFDGRAISVRGKLIDARAAVFLKDAGDAADDIDYRAVLDAIPTPTWVRGADLNLRWGNRAFLDATGFKRLSDAAAANASLERSECELAAAARDGTRIIVAKRYALIGAKRRALALNFSRLDDASIAGVAIDVTEVAQAEAALRLNADAAADLLDGLSVGIAIFGKDQRLESANELYVKMWGLSEEWLATRPTLGEILERLRDQRKLPEQANFQNWKGGQIRQFESCSAEQEEFWHLPGGKSLRVRTRPHLLGGVYTTFEDLSEQLRLEASFKLLTQVQRATLDVIEEGIAVFAPDGRLVLHNKTFASLWRLTEEELTNQPHFSQLSNLTEARIGRDSIWSIVSVGLTSGELERCSEWGKAVRADGRIISVAMSRLPNGATAVTFADLTDIERFRDLNAETSHAIA